MEKSLVSSYRIVTTCMTPIFPFAMWGYQTNIFYHHGTEKKETCASFFSIGNDFLTCVLLLFSLPCAIFFSSRLRMLHFLSNCNGFVTLRSDSRNLIYLIVSRSIHHITRNLDYSLSVSLPFNPNTTNATTAIINPFPQLHQHHN